MTDTSLKSCLPLKSLKNKCVKCQIIEKAWSLKSFFFSFVCMQVIKVDMSASFAYSDHGDK